MKTWVGIKIETWKKEHLRKCHERGQVLRRGAFRLRIQDKVLWKGQHWCCVCELTTSSGRSCWGSIGFLRWGHTSIVVHETTHLGEEIAEVRVWEEEGEWGRTCCRPLLCKLERMGRDAMWRGISAECKWKKWPTRVPFQDQLGMSYFKDGFDKNRIWKDISKIDDYCKIVFKKLWLFTKLPSHLWRWWFF